MDKFTQAGNFIFRHYNDRSRLKVSNITNDWNISFSANTEMFGFLTMLMENEKIEILHLFAVTWYQCTNTWKTDPKFYDDWADTFQGLYDRMADALPPVTEEEHEAALDELRATYREQETPAAPDPERNTYEDEDEEEVPPKPTAQTDAFGNEIPWNHAGGEPAES